MIGQLAGNYKILSCLGEGGMGTVYKAVDVMLEREVAIKMLRPEIASQPQVLERFRGEAVTLAKLNHPSIATLYSFFRQGDQFFMVMEYVAGETLDSAIRQSGAMPAGRAAAILCQALEGIGHAHAMGILHRDLKPSNIMLPYSGGVKVMDFGIARLLSAARMTRTGGLVGTLEYVAPERVRGQEEDFRSDLYSMGIVLYEMLTGRVPFQSDTEYELMRAQLEQAPPALASLGIEAPPAVEEALIRALAKNPEERFASAAEFREALLNVPAAVAPKPTRLAGLPPAKETRMVVETPPAKETRLAEALPAAPPATVLAAAPVHKSDWKLYAGVAAAIVLLGSAGGFWAFHRSAPAAQTVPSAPSGAPLASSTPPGGLGSVPGSSGLPDLPSRENPSNAVKKLLSEPDTTPTPHAPSKPRVSSVKKEAPAVAVPPEPIPTPQPVVPVVQPPPARIPPPRPAAATLLDVRHLYIEPMPYGLNKYIALEIITRLGDRIQLVTTADRADAIMAGTTMQRGGGPGRAMGVQSDGDASVVVMDRTRTHVIWRGEATSRTVLGGVVRKGGPPQLADRLVTDMMRDINRVMR